MRQWLKCPINEKSSILLQSCSYFGYLVYLLVLYFDKVSWRLNKNRRISINGDFLGVSHFFRYSLYYHRYYQKYADFDIFFCTFFCRTLVSRDADCHSSCGGSGGNHPDHLDLHFVCSKGRNVLLPHGSLWKAKTVRYREVRNGKMGSNNKNGAGKFFSIILSSRKLFFALFRKKKDWAWFNDNFPYLVLGGKKATVEKRPRPAFLRKRP